ncbi:MAG: HAD family phosphatase [Phycisphaeraceae bacterium]
MLKAVVLDFDGVIVNSEPLHFRSFQHVVRELGLDLTWQQYVQKYIGYDNRDLFGTFLADAGRADLLEDEHRLAELCQRKGDAFEAAVEQGVPTTPGLAVFVDEVSANMPIAIASGASRRDIDLVLTRLGWLERFGVIVSADDVSRSKPDPETYRLAFEALARQNSGLGLRPSDCLAIEDTGAGIVSARGAGMMVLGLTHWSSADALQGAHHIAANFDNLTLSQLQQWFDD